MAAKIYTRKGDEGQTSLCGGSKTGKDALRVDAYGTVDELMSFIGLCIVKLEQEEVKDHLLIIQNDLHIVGSNLAYPENLSQSQIDGQSIAFKIPHVTEQMITRLENWIDSYEDELPELINFIISGTTELSALLHIARNVCRRTERIIVKLKAEEELDKNVMKYVNRLSDYLFTAARLVSKREGREDIKWIPKTTLDEWS